MLTGVKGNRGFTLIEVLVVLAISSILMALVMAPVVQTFALTRQAQAMVNAQDAAREGMEQISRDLGQAMYVYDNANTPINLPVPDGSSGTGTVNVPMQYARIDFILPKMVMHCNSPTHPTTQPRDYARDVLDTSSGNTYTYAWPSCPYCEAAGLPADDVEARPKLPLEQDVTIVRYFLGLANNNLGATMGTNNVVNQGWQTPWTNNALLGNENQVVLYRVEFSPFDPNLFPDVTPENALKNMNNPDFFYQSGNATGTGGNGQPFTQNWAAISKVIGIGKYEDLAVVAATDSSNPKLITAVDPTITFRTTKVDNDSAAGTYTSDKSFEYPDTSPAVCAATYGFWTPDNTVTVYRNNYDIGYVTGPDPNGTSDTVIMRWQGQSSTQEFDITDYLLVKGYVQPTNNGAHPEMAFTIDANKGNVNFAMVAPRPKTDEPLTDPVCTLDPDAINTAFRGYYAQNRSGTREFLLPTFDSAQSTQYLQHAVIVPGSETVFGPDATPGLTKPRTVRYQRVPLNLGDAGLNQYKIGYDTGYIYFSSVFNEDLPVYPTGKTTDWPTTSADYISTNWPITVDYKIQFNKTDDVVKADYATKSLITVHMSMRMFDPESGKAHPVDLTKSIKIRNLLR